MKKIIAAGVLFLFLINLFTGPFHLNFLVNAAESQLLSSSWHLTGNNSAAENYQNVDPNILKNATGLKISYNLHGLCALPGDASAIIFDQNGWKYIALSKYGQNCKDGEQTVTIPISDFKDIGNGQTLDMNTPLTGQFHTRFWYAKSFTVDITAASVIKPDGGITPPVPSVSVPNPAVTSPPALPTTSSVVTNFIGITGTNPLFSGKIYMGYKANPTSTQKVDFLIDGSLKTSEKFSPYYLGGDNAGQPIGWDTRQIPDGQHTVSVTVLQSNGSKYSDQVTFRTNNANLPVTAVPTLSVSTPTGIGKPTSTVTPTTIPVGNGSSWAIQSVDAMKDTKDAICGQRPQAWIERWVDKAVELGANYVAISTPYDNPDCASSLPYTQMWVNVIRSRGLKVWFRQMPLAFEGIYSKTKNNSNNFLTLISNYIKANPGLYQDGDIFTPIPEPQNGGIQGITYCANGVCQFPSKENFNQWLRDAINVSRSAFQSIGKNNMKIGYFGFDGFVAWGANNPDWNGILEDTTIAAMGNITIDHYPEAIGSTMKQGLDELQARYPGIQIIIGEWGTINNTNVEQEVRDSMAAAKRQGVVGFNYWQFGPGGAGEQLINDDFSNRVQFDEVRSFYRS